MPQIHVVDHFYDDPVAVRHFALSQAQYQDSSQLPAGYSGTESTRGYFSDGIVSKISRIIGEDIEVDDRSFSFGVFVKKIKNDEELRAIHVDRSRWTAIVYLSPEPASNSGTLIYKHVPTNSETFASQYQERYAADSLRPSQWQITAAVGNAFNRLVVFESGHLFHSGGDYFGDQDSNCRLTQVFFFNSKARGL